MIRIDVSRQPYADDIAALLMGYMAAILYIFFFFYFFFCQRYLYVYFFY